MKKSTIIFDFFKRKASNDLEANTSGVTLPTTNVEENPNVPIEENLNITIEENPDELVEENLNVPIEENLDIPIKENSQTKFQKVDMSCCNYNVILDHVGKHILIMLINKMRSGRYIKLSPYRPLCKKF